MMQAELLEETAALEISVMEADSVDKVQAHPLPTAKAMIPSIPQFALPVSVDTIYHQLELVSKFPSSAATTTSKPEPVSPATSVSKCKMANATTPTASPKQLPDALPAGAASL